MSLAGFKKQLNKANQYMSEKIGGAKGTELDDEFLEMERKVDVTGKLVEEVMARTHEYLQPNPASRAKLSAVNSISKMRGTAKHTMYPQPEGLLGECMVKYGKELGEEAPFGAALADTGEAYKQLADIKYSLEDNVKQNFIEPLHHLQTKDLKEVNHHRKKLQGRRLDYDCKKRKQAKGHVGQGHQGGASNVTEEEIMMAEEKFEESKQLAETAMYNLLENDVEQISQLSSFIEAQIDYHRQATDILSSLGESLQQRVTEAASRPKRERQPKRAVSSSNFDKSPAFENNFDLADSTGYSLSPAPTNYSSQHDLQQVFGYKQYGGAYGDPPPAYNKVAYGGNHTNDNKTPCAEALYDFDPENDGELGFKEGDMITLTSRIDENWFEGTIHGASGFFPVNYVKVVVELP